MWGQGRGEGVTAVLDKGRVSTGMGTGLAREVRMLGTGKVLPNLTMVVINSSPTSGICINEGRTVYGRLNVRSRGCTLPGRAARSRLIGLIRGLGGSSGVRNVLIRLPLPGKLGRGTIVGAVGPRGSISTFRPIGINGVVVKSCSFIPYAPTKVVRVVGRDNYRVRNGGYIIVNEDGVINGPVSVLLLRGGNAIAAYRSEAGGLGRVAGGTSVLITTMNETRFMATSVIGRNTIMVSINVGELRSNALANSISCRTISGVTNTVAPIPNNINPVAVSVLVRGAIATTRGGTWGYTGGVVVIRKATFPVSHGGVVNLHLRTCFISSLILLLFLLVVGTRVVRTGVPVGWKVTGGGTVSNIPLGPTCLPTRSGLR